MRAAMALVGVTAVLALVEVALADGLPGLFGAFGVAGCAAIVVVSKLLGKHWLHRPEPPDE